VNASLVKADLRRQRRTAVATTRKSMNNRTSAVAE
jgi:hypothetical protein